jgi:hypothetical protein
VFQESWRQVVATAVQLGIPTPAFSAALAFYDSYRSEILPANLIQAQRDYFGAHTYELVGQRGVYHHTNWTGKLICFDGLTTFSFQEKVAESLQTPTSLNPPVINLNSRSC